MTKTLFSSMLRLVYPPHSTKADAALVEALARNTAATDEINDRAGNIDRALANIRDAAEGIFV